MPRINRRHPLAQGLVGLWFPAGGSLILDLSGNMQPLTATNTANGAGPYGYQARDTNVGPSFWSTANVPTVQKPAAQLSLLWVAQYIGGAATPGQFPIAFGCAFTSSVSPYASWGVDAGNGMPYFFWNNGSAQVGLNLPASSVGLVYAAVGTVLLGGPATLWNRGSFVTSAAAPGGTVSYASVEFLIGGGGSGNTSNAGFGFSLGALWNRALPAGVAQALSADPWQILELPPDRLPRALSSANLSLGIDRTVPAEFQTAVVEPGAIDTSPYLDTGDGSWLSTGDGSWLLTGTEAAGPWAPIEIVGNVEMAPRDILVPLESGLAARRDIAAAAEVLCTAATDRDAAFESVSRHRFDPSAPAESSALWRLDAEAPDESGLSLANGQAMPAENAGSILADGETRAEWLGQPPIIVLSADWLEFLASARANPPAAGESGGAIAADRAIAAEVGLTARADGTAPVEPLGQPILFVLTGDWLGWLASQRAEGVPAEWTALLTALRPGAAEWAALSAADRAAVVAWLRGFAADPAADGEAPLEFGQTNPPPLFLVARGRLR